MKRYFKDEILSSENELLKTDVNSRKHYVVANYNNGDLLNIESFFNGKILIVTYFVNRNQNSSSILQYHKTNYSSVKAKLVYPIEYAEGFSLRKAYFYNEILELDYIIQYWKDKNDIDVKEVYFNSNDEKTGSQKFLYNTNNELQFAFEYDEFGGLFNVYDFLNGSSISVETIRQKPNLEFYFSD